jgi:hypothetical protein
MNKIEKMKQSRSKFNLLALQVFYELPENLSYVLYMKKARKRGDLLWLYHDCQKEIKRLIQRKVYNPDEIYSFHDEKPILKEKWKQNLLQLIEFLSDCPNKRKNCFAQKNRIKKLEFISKEKIKPEITEEL